MIERIIDERHRDLDGFEVGRVLPWPERQARGPFVVFNRGPAEFTTRLSGKVDVLPHSHISRSLSPHLFEGEIMEIWRRHCAADPCS